MNTHEHGIVEVQQERLECSWCEPDLSLLAQQLVAASRWQGVQLTGLTKQELETAFDAGLTDLLGQERERAVDSRMDRPLPLFAWTRTADKILPHAARK